jgi:hypothetical protein
MTMRRPASKENAVARLLAVLSCAIGCNASSDERATPGPDGTSEGVSPQAASTTANTAARPTLQPGDVVMSPPTMGSGAMNSPSVGSGAGGSPPVSAVPANTVPEDPASDPAAEPMQSGRDASVEGVTDAGTELAEDAASVASAIVVEGRQVLVAGEPIHLRGVNWNPVARGATHPEGLDFAGFAAGDIPLMQAAGINAVRTYEPLLDGAVLDRLQEAGIFVFCTVYGWWQDDPSVVTQRVDAVKDHPAILAWVLGNEWNYNHLYGYGNATWEQTRDRLNAAATAVKVADPSRPVASIYGEFERLEEALVSMPDIDLWGINAYRGIGFGDLFASFQALSSKPLFLGEYGADAYNTTLEGAGGYDPTSQADAVRALTVELLDNSSTAGGVTLGGFVFEWADEWWKAEGSLDVQDIGGIAPGGGPYPDGTFNEEWWGIVDIERVPRPAYDVLRELYLADDVP